MNSKANRGRSCVLAKLANLSCERWASRLRNFNFLATFDAHEISSTESKARLTWFTVGVRSRYTNERCWTTSKPNYSRLKAPWPNVLNCADFGQLFGREVWEVCSSLRRTCSNVKRLKVQDCLWWYSIHSKVREAKHLPRVASCVHLHLHSCANKTETEMCWFASLSQTHKRQIQIKFFFLCRSTKF